MDVSKNSGVSPKMDGENHGKNPINPWDEFGGKLPQFSKKHPYTPQKSNIDTQNLTWR